MLGVRVNMIYCNLTIFFDVHSGQRRIWSNSPFLVVIPSFFYSFRTRWFYTLQEFCQSGIETLVIYIVINWNTAKLSFLPELVEINFIWVFFLGISWNSCYWGFFAGINNNSCYPSFIYFIVIFCTFTYELGYLQINSYIVDI